MRRFPAIYLRWLLCSSACLSMSGCDSMTEVHTPAAAPDSVTTSLRRDAAIVAHNMLWQIHQQYREDYVGIPTPVINRIYNAMLDVWRSRSLERDSVIELYSLRPRSSWSLSQVLSYQELDTALVGDLLEQYGFAVTPPSEPFGVFYSYSSDSIVNTWALMKQLHQRLPDSVNVQMNFYVGDSDNIWAHFERDGVLLGYELAYGDCPSGCASRRTYLFRVDNLGIVQALGGFGDPPCDPKHRM
jgi:hypothetical protein